jgi:hypothetical protein
LLLQLTELFVDCCWASPGFVNTTSKPTDSDTQYLSVITIHQHNIIVFTSSHIIIPIIIQPQVALFIILQLSI